VGRIPKKAGETWSGGRKHSGRVRVSFRLPQRTTDRIKRLRAAWGCSATEVVERAISEVRLLDGGQVGTLITETHFKIEE